MGDTTATENISASTKLDFIELLLGTLGFTSDEFVSLFYMDVDGAEHTAVMVPPDAVAAAATIPATANAYFGVNPTRGPTRINRGRGTEADVTRLTSLWVDLDVKPGGCPSLQVAHAIVDDLSAVLGTRPSATVKSGHGLHAYWEISDGHVVDGAVGAVRALVKRWGRLVAVVAAKRDASVDNVYDLARMLRIPGSLNNKTRTNGADPLPVIGYLDAGAPLSLAEIDERLTEIGVLEEDDDRQDREQVSDPTGWTFADNTCGYLAAFLDGLPSDGPKSGGGRHQWLLKQAVRLACGWRLGCLTDTDYRRAGQLLEQRLTRLRAATGQQVGRFEVANALRFGVEVTSTKTDEQARTELGDHSHDDDTTTAEAFTVGTEDDELDFWSQTATLAHIHAFARSRGASPYATLGAVLRRATGCIEPHVVLPPTVGGQVSLNLFTAPVGSSGAGKDIANEAGHDAVDFYVSFGGALVAVDDATAIHPGTGEGLARVFAGRGNQPGETRAHLQVPDIATLEALAERKGQTLVAQLLAAFMGQAIGFSNNSRDSSTAVRAHRYRLCLSVGVQPENAGFFLSREKDGLPQRFLWLPTNDPGAPRKRPAEVAPLAVELPQFVLREGATRIEIPIPAPVAAEIWDHRWQVLTDAKGVNPLDAHLKLTQLKVAAALAVLHGQGEVTCEVWTIARQLIAVSSTVRAGLAGAIKARRRQENTAKAHDQADRRTIVETRMVTDRHQRIRAQLLRRLAKVGAEKQYILSRSIDSTVRGDFNLVFAQCVDEGLIVCCKEDRGTRAPRYRLADH
jgi:hypothetical protein